MEFLSCDKLVYLLHEKKDHTGYMPSSFTTQAWLREASFLSRKLEMLVSVVLQPPATCILPRGGQGGRTRDSQPTAGTSDPRRDTLSQALVLVQT